MDLFFVGKLKKKFMKPSEIKPEEEKEYYCVGEVPENGIATYDQGYFLPREAFHSIVLQQSDEIDKLKKELLTKEIEYDRLKQKYDLLLKSN